MELDPSRRVPDSGLFDVLTCFNVRNRWKMLQIQHKKQLVEFEIQSWHLAHHQHRMHRCSVTWWRNLGACNQASVQTCHGSLDSDVFGFCSDRLQCSVSLGFWCFFFKYATKTAQRLEMIRLKISNLPPLPPSMFVLNVLGNCNLQLCLHDVTNMLRQEVVPLPSSRRRSKQRSNYKYITSNTGETLKPFKKVSKYQERRITKIHIQKGKHFVLKAQSDNVSFKFRVFPVSC